METRKGIWFGLFGVFLAINVLVAILMYIFLIPDKIKTDMFKHKEVPIVSHGQLLVEEAAIDRGTIYLPLEVIKNRMDASLYEEDNGTIVITRDGIVYAMKPDETTMQVNGNAMAMERPVKKFNQQWHIPSDVLETIYPFDIQQEAKDGKTIVVLTSKEKSRQIGVTTFQTGNPVQKGILALKKLLMVKKAAEYYLMEEPNKRSTIVYTIKDGTEAEIIREEENWYFVQLENGYFGYIEKKFMTLKGIKEKEVDTAKNKKAQKFNGEKIHMVWDGIYGANPNVQTLPDMPGVHVLSPTWFELKNEKGEVDSKADDAYVSWAKAKGYQVWGLFSNAFKPDLTHQVLAHYDSRQTAIQQIMYYAKAHRLDGINIDFENVHLKDKEALVQFTRELSVYTQQEGLVLSLDVTPHSTSETWSMFYDRKQLGEIVDYIALMAYDEHWADSPKAGSVASLPWTEDAVTKLIQEVPHDKIILGVPFYTRVWKEQGGSVKSDTLALKYKDEWIKNNAISVLRVDEASGQNYIEGTDAKTGSKVQVWLEDEVSIRKRIELVDKYDLAGIGSWQRDFAPDSVWTFIDKELNPEK